jgi:hypothetical protein
MRNLFLITVFLSTSAAADAQTAFNWYSPQQANAMNEGFGNQVVTGKPFSATEERRTLQILGNGTRIENSQSSRLYRDSEGRTRVEGMDDAVSIADPVAGFRMDLNLKLKTARRSIFLPVWLERSPYGARLGLRGGRGRGPQTDTVDPAQASGNTVTENLGTEMVNGISAQGTRTTVTIRKGQIGNDRDIKIVTERWFSNDLNLLVKSLNSDPRFGDTTYQLTRIAQGSPEPSLFQIPPDFTVTGGLPGAARGGGRGGRSPQ